MAQTFQINPKIVARRRAGFCVYALILFGLGMAPMVSLLGARHWNFAHILLLGLFIPLFAQIVYGFALVSAGFWVLRRGGDPLRINESVPRDEFPASLPATAIVMPIYNEDVSRVFERLRVMYEALAKTGSAAAFDFFILSDSNDPNHWIAEEDAWVELCKQVGGFGRIFYRKRRVLQHNKSGNISDFCRRWGASYRYMIVLDADSLMAGQSFVRLATLMEHHPEVGIIQTYPKMILGETLFQRIMQFGTFLCGPMFTAGANYWQMGAGNYWGHNAIIRVRPFMEHCAVPELPPDSPFGQQILSHDTVEAALMQRAGYQVWTAYDVDGSYEESPPDLLAAMQRDRRWCLGNLQHSHLLFAGGFRLFSRFHFLNGILAYLSSLLWLLFLLLSTFAAVQEPPASFGGFFIRSQGTFLFAYVMVILLLPKALGALQAWKSPEKQSLGGTCRLLLNVVGETLFSMLLAPVIMLFHAQFVCASIAGSKVSWGAQNRGDGQLSWGQITRVVLPRSLFMLVWLALLAWLRPAYVPWMSLIFLGPLVAIPLIRWTASARLGAFARARGWFLVPEETDPCPEIRQFAELNPPPAAPLARLQRFAPDYGLLQAILDPFVNAIHVSFLRHRPLVNLRTRAYTADLSQKLLHNGPAALTDHEKRTLLWDADAVTEMHQRLWSSPAGELAEWWQEALRFYTRVNAFSVRKMVDGR